MTTSFESVRSDDYLTRLADSANGSAYKNRVITGRLPKWCLENCRHLAWEHRRALAANRDQVQVINQVVTVERTVHVDKRIEVRVPVTPGRGEWPALLHDLAAPHCTERPHLSAQGPFSTETAVSFGV